MAITRNGNELLFDTDDLIVSKTDTKGKISYGNDLFIELSGFTEGELLGQPHNMVRHSDMPKVIFKLLWKYIQGGQEIYAYVVNRAKGGEHYWVLANVTPSFDTNGSIIGYYSVRRKPREEALAIIKPFYAELLQIEKSGGIEASEKRVEQMLSEKEVGYDEFILSF